MIVQMQKPQHKSTNVAAVGFAGDGRGKLRVQFVDGTIGEYDDVPRAVYEALMRDKSPGGFLHKNVIGHFAWRKLSNLRYVVRLEIHEVEIDPASSPLIAGNVDSPDPWTLCACVTLKDAIAYRNGMTVMSEVVTEHLQKEDDARGDADKGKAALGIEDSATAENASAGDKAQS